MLSENLEFEVEQDQNSFWYHIFMFSYITTSTVPHGQLKYQWLNINHNYFIELHFIFISVLTTIWWVQYCEDWHFTSVPPWYHPEENIISFLVTMKVCTAADLMLPHGTCKWVTPYKGAEWHLSPESSWVGSSHLTAAHLAGKIYPLHISQ